MVPADSRRISRVPRYSGSGLAPGHGFRLRGFHPLRPGFPAGSAILSRSLSRPALQPRTARRHASGLGSSAFARHYLRNHCYFLFLRVLRCFSSPGSHPHYADAGIASGGLPHSEIRGSNGICPSPRLIAACHVLLRLREPRHPSCALVSFPWFLYFISSVSTSLLTLRILRCQRFVHSYSFARLFIWRFQYVNVLLPVFRSPWQS